MRAPNLFSLMLDRLLYGLVRGVLALMRLLPLRALALLGQAGGLLAWALDRRHRRVAIENLTAAFGEELSPREIRALARLNFRRIGEAYACAARTALMSDAAVRRVLEVTHPERLHPGDPRLPPNRILAVGHFGNFEIYARWAQWVPPFKFATTYRALNQPALDRVLQELRQRSGCLYFERRTQMRALQRIMKGQPLMLGFLADQHAGQRGLRLPFFGRECSTNPSPAVFALRYQCPLHVCICYRVGLARWRIENSEPIPTHDADGPRSVADIMRDVNRAYEEAIRRDPANWFWVHRRWKGGGRPVESKSSPTPPTA
jgi:KDO2-lipid IV(A) lauroyltransferase